MQSGVADPAAAQADRLAQESEVQAVLARRPGGQQQLPEAGPGGGVGTRKVDDHLEAAGEGRVEVTAQVGGQDIDDTRHQFEFQYLVCKCGAQLLHAGGVLAALFNSRDELLKIYLKLYKLTTNSQSEGWQIDSWQLID